MFFLKYLTPTLKAHITQSESDVSQSCLTLTTPCTISHQAPLSMEFFGQEYWSGLPFPPPGDLPNPGIEPASPALAGRFFTTGPLGKPKQYI